MNSCGDDSMKRIKAITTTFRLLIAPALTALAVFVLGMFTPADAIAQTGIRAQPPTYVTYNVVASRYHRRAHEISLNVNNPPASTYNAIATPPPAQFSFLRTSDGVNLQSTVQDRTTGKLVDTIPMLPPLDGTKPLAFGWLVAARAWNAA